MFGDLVHSSSMDKLEDCNTTQRASPLGPLLAFSTCVCENPHGYIWGPLSTQAPESFPPESATPEADPPTAQETPTATAGVPVKWSTCDGREYNTVFRFPDSPEPDPGNVQEPEPETDYDDPVARALSFMQLSIWDMYFDLDDWTSREEQYISVIPTIDPNAIALPSDELTCDLGRGTFGQVHSATLLLNFWTPVPVAIKTFLGASKATYTPTKIIAKEALFLCHLQGLAAVPRFYGMVRSFPNWYLVQEKIANGLTLKKAVNLDLLWEDDKIPIMRQMVKGLRDIHNRKVLHNDLKMDNVLVDISYRPARVYYIDFGAASFKVGMPLDFSNCSSAIMKHHKVAPEIIKGRESSAASDVYALGRILNCLNFKIPPAWDSLRALAFECLRVDPDKRPSLSAILERLDKMAKQPG